MGLSHFGILFLSLFVMFQWDSYVWTGFILCFFSKPGGITILWASREKRRSSKWIWWEKGKMYKKHISMHEQMEPEVGICEFHWRITRNHHKMTHKTRKTILEQILDSLKKIRFFMNFDDFSRFFIVHQSAIWSPPVVHICTKMSGFAYFLVRNEWKWM